MELDQGKALQRPQFLRAIADFEACKGFAFCG
jgi:hypothetical protein